MSSKLYLDSSQPVEIRVKDLLRKMTLEEKIGQMAGTIFINLEKAREDIKDSCLGVGAPLMFANSPKILADFTNALQKFAVEETHLGIPLLLYLDAVHGHASVKGATVFPHNLGLAATWDPDLAVKFRLGLFENPYVDPERAGKLVGCKEHREIALLAARESMTLLKNQNNLLPLSKDIGTILVTGPNADNIENQLGGWSNTFPPSPPATTILEGIKSKVSPATEVLYTKGSGIREPENIEEAKELAKKSDAAIVVVGEPAYVHEFWTVQDITSSMGQIQKEGLDALQKRLLARLEQFPCRMMLDLPQSQLNLIKAVHETGTPTIVVLITGRPLTIKWIAETIPAILMGYLPGTEGGNAVADVLFGDYTPGGKLPISIARSMGQLPVRYDYKPHPFAEMLPPAYAPLFEFGFGLSYTRFEYDDLKVSPNKVGPSGKVNVGVTVRNIGERTGDEVIQLYINDLYSSRVTPIRELKGFKRMTLMAGESKRVEFSLYMEDIGVFQDDRRFVTELGAFRVIVGGLESSFEVVR